jgi:hypothetical protein
METMMEMSMEGALSVLSDPAVLALEGALFTAWALAEVRLQKKANQAKEYAALNGKFVLRCRVARFISSWDLAVDEKMNCTWFIFLHVGFPVDYTIIASSGRHALHSLRSIISDRTKELWAQQNAGQPGDGDGEKGSSYSSVASSFEALSLESMYGRYVSQLDPKCIDCARLDHVKATMIIQL